MHLTVRVPKVEPAQILPPTRCPLPHPRHPKRKCSGRHFKLHQLVCSKPLRDTRYTRVIAQRYRCLTCGRSFRVYPTGVSKAQHSDTLKGVSVLLYILGLSYQGVSDLLEGLGFFLGKTTVYHNVQAAGRRAIRLRKQWVPQQAGKIKVLGIDFTHVKCQGQDKILAVATALLQGQPLTFDLVEAETTLRTEQGIRELAHTIGAEVGVTDDADGLKTVADHLGLQQQICRAHVNRNVHRVSRYLRHDLIAALGTKALGHPDPVPWELRGEVTVDQFKEDWQDLEWIIKGVPWEGQVQLEKLAARYQGAPPPPQGGKAVLSEVEGCGIGCGA